MKGKGWHGNSRGHSLAARGIKLKSEAKKRTAKDKVIRQLESKRAGRRSQDFDLRSTMYSGFGFGNVVYDNKPFWKVLPDKNARALRLVSQLMVDKETQTPYIFEVFVEAHGDKFRPSSYDVIFQMSAVDFDNQTDAQKLVIEHDIWKASKNFDQTHPLVNPKNFLKRFGSYAKDGKGTTEANEYAIFVKGLKSEFIKGMPSITTGAFLREFNAEMTEAIKDSEYKISLLKDEDYVATSKSSTLFEEVEKEKDIDRIRRKFQ